MEEEKIGVSATGEREVTEEQPAQQQPEQSEGEKQPVTQEAKQEAAGDAAQQTGNEEAVVEQAQPETEQPGQKAESEEKAEMPVEQEAEPEDAAGTEEQAPAEEETAPEGQPEETGETSAEEEGPKEEPKWYIVQTLTGQEDKVKERIEAGIEENNLKTKVFRVLLPEEETVEIKGDKRLERKRKMYPGYVFIEMLLDEDVWYKIRSTQGVARFIGGKTSPTPVTDREMQRVLKQLGIKEKEVKVEFEIGEPIRIISGSFRGYTGSVAEVNAAKSKIKAMISIFGRDTSVEVDFDRVEKVV